MYSVVYFLDHDPSARVTLFRSMVERDCWDFIRRRMESTNKYTRKHAPNLYVIDSAEAFCEPPEDVRALNRAVKIAS